MGSRKLTSLSRRQRQCLALRLRHFTDKEIAGKLQIAPATVSMHLRAARAKLGAKSTIEAARAMKRLDKARNELEPARPTNPQLDLGHAMEKAAHLAVGFAAALAVLYFACLVTHRPALKFIASLRKE